MLTYSNGGNAYAVLANNPEYALGVLPVLTLNSTTVFLALRCRYQSLMTDYLDPMLMPKAVLVGGIERSKNTLRSTALRLNTGFTLDKIGSGFPEIVAKKLVACAPGILVGLPADEGVCLHETDIRHDFVEDFAKLVEAAITPVYPPKTYKGTAPLISVFDLNVYEENGDKIQSALHAVPDEGAKVTKLPLKIKGGDDEPELPDTKGVDNAPEDPSSPAGKDKIKLFGKAPEPTES